MFPDANLDPLLVGINRQHIKEPPTWDESRRAQVIDKRGCKPKQSLGRIGQKLGIQVAIGMAQPNAGGSQVCIQAKRAKFHDTLPGD
jgi:hypothetical protein